MLEGPWQLGPPHPKCPVPPTGISSQRQTQGHGPLPWWDSPMGPSHSGAPEGSGEWGLSQATPLPCFCPPPSAPITPSVIQGPVSGSAPGLGVQHRVFLEHVPSLWWARSAELYVSPFQAARSRGSPLAPPGGPGAVWPWHAAIAQSGRGSPHKGRRTQATQLRA